VLYCPGRQQLNAALGIAVSRFLTILGACFLATAVSSCATTPKLNEASALERARTAAGRVDLSFYQSQKPIPNCGRTFCIWYVNFLPLNSEHEAFAVYVNERTGEATAESNN